MQGELQRVDEAQLRATVLPYVQRGFFAVQPDKIQAAVTALPWVERAEVRKHWPDVLEVRTVSYTHLDVYKRQGIARPAQRAERAGRIRGGVAVGRGQ